MSATITKGEKLNSSFMLFWITLKKVFNSKPFVLLLMSYGLNMGVYYSICTLLGQLIKPVYLMNSDMDRNIGLMGLVMSVVGLVGTFSAGLVIQKFKKFKVSSPINTNLTTRFTIRSRKVQF